MVGEDFDDEGKITKSLSSEEFRRDENGEAAESGDTGRLSVYSDTY